MLRILAADGLDSSAVSKLEEKGYEVTSQHYEPEEPCKDERLLHHPKISMTPHIGASTKEAQKRIGEEIVKLITEKFDA